MSMIVVINEEFEICVVAYCVLGHINLGSGTYNDVNSTLAITVYSQYGCSIMCYFCIIVQFNAQ